MQHTDNIPAFTGSNDDGKGWDRVNQAHVRLQHRTAATDLGMKGNPAILSPLSPSPWRNGPPDVPSHTQI